MKSKAIKFSDRIVKDVRIEIDPDRLKRWQPSSIEEKFSYFDICVSMRSLSAIAKSIHKVSSDVHDM